jgi:hypothetical protein
MRKIATKEQAPFIFAEREVSGIKEAQNILNRTMTESFTSTTISTLSYTPSPTLPPAPDILPIPQWSLKELAIIVSSMVGTVLISALVYCSYRYCVSICCISRPVRHSPLPPHIPAPIAEGVELIAPIGISLKSNQIESIGLTKSQILFDYFDNGVKVATAWIGPKDAFLIYDHNDNKQVDTAIELVLTRWSATAKTDFIALKEVFDSNKDNKFDSKDAEFNRFYIWQDKNQDGVSQTEELRSLQEASLLHIDFSTEQTIKGEFFGKQQEMQVAGVLWENGHQTLAYDLALEISNKL